MTKKRLSEVILFPSPSQGEMSTLDSGISFPTWAIVEVSIETDVRPWLRLTIEIKDGQPVLTELHVSEQQITTTALRDIPLTELTERAIALVARRAYVERDLRDQRQNGVPYPDDVPSEIHRVGAEAITGRRRAVTTDLLKQVAAVVVANPSKPTKAVADQLFTSHRNATRWIATARERGLLVDGFSSEENEK